MLIHRQTGRMKRRLGMNLQRIRRERGLTQEQLEEMTGLSQATISGYETGRAGWTRKAIFRLADVLEIDVEELFMRSETREQLGGAQILEGLSPQDIERLRAVADSFRQFSRSTQ